MRGDRREYKMATDPYVVPVTGQMMREIRKYEDGEGPQCVLVVPNDSAMDARAALEIAYREGRWARSDEILGDAGLARAAMEMGRHHAMLDNHGPVMCTCGKHDGPDQEAWNVHVAYEILQAAAQL